MASNRGRYATWAKNLVPEGYTVQRKDGRYYLYVDRDLPGGPRSAGDGESVGEIMPDGIRWKHSIKDANFVIYEFGFTKACLDICPNDWKRYCGEKWLAHLHAAIRTKSPSSYELVDKVLDETLNGKLQAKRLDVYLKQIGTCLQELWENLHDVQMIYYPDTGERIVNQLSPAQLAYSEKYRINLKEM